MRTFAPLALMAMILLSGCATGPTVDAIQEANTLQGQIQSQTLTIAEQQRRINELNALVMSPPIGTTEADVAAARDELASVEARRAQLEAEIAANEQRRDELLEPGPTRDAGEVAGAIIPWLPPPFNMIAAALLGLSPLLLRKKETTP